MRVLKTIAAGLLALALWTAPSWAAVAWTYSADDAVVNMVNTASTPALCQYDTFIGDQTTCGSNLACYFHGTSVASIPVAAGAHAVIPIGAIWENIFSDGVTDYHTQAFFVVWQCTKTSQCPALGNRYMTTETNPGQAGNIPGTDGYGPVWISHQGGSSGKNCDNGTGTIPPNTLVQIISDNSVTLNPLPPGFFGPTPLTDANGLPIRPPVPKLDLSHWQHQGAAIVEHDN